MLAGQEASMKAFREVQADKAIRKALSWNITPVEELPANTPAKWCHKMVVISKPGSTKARRTVDMSALKTANYREFTNFVTEWGMFHYKRIPMGDHVSMDAYFYMFDKVTVEVKNKIC
jgi:hypothetical protein